MRRLRWQFGTLIMGFGWVVAGSAASAFAWQEPALTPAVDPALNEPEGGQVLTRGPLHEAFAEPLLYDPKPGAIVAKSPPKPINEIPPEQKPAGDNVQWIPGYWAWDDARNDYVWISGVWRAIPPGRQWMPGYWQEARGGYQWVPGYWGSTEAAQAQYLPEPPASIENGPSSQPPASDAVWSPGMWVWQDNQYAWRPGFWVNNQPGWMWTPASYSWTPNGYLYNQGYWDYPLANRGIPFAPVYFSGASYTQPNFSYSPAVGLLTSGLLSSLFVRPSYGSYYFGDYYAPNNFQSGIYPWYSFHGSRYGYDPLYAYAAAQNYSTNPNWANQLHETYRYRREHAEARPPRTFAETRTLAARPVAGAGAGSNAITGAASNLVLARPFQQIANPGAGTGPAANANAAANAMQFERLDKARRQELAQQSTQLHKFREERSRRELEAGRAAATPDASKARQLDLPRSPISYSAPQGQGQGQRNVVPAVPQHPEFDRSIPPSGAAGSAPKRFEPHADIRPPAPYVAPGRPATPPPGAPGRSATPPPGAPGRAVTPAPGGPAPGGPARPATPAQPKTPKRP
jgi:hypothetical protein